MAKSNIRVLDITTSKRMRFKQLEAIIESEGLGYAVQSYISASQVPKSLEDAWKRAGEALDEIDAIIQKKLGPKE